MRIVHLSDPHLSRRRAYFLGNVLTARRLIAEIAPDLVIDTGDLSIDGADVEDDLRFAHEVHARLGPRWRAVPGNHDVGEEPTGAHLHQFCNAERLARYRGVFGPDWWSEDAPGWRLIGLNALLFGTGLADEAEQWAWLAETVAGAGDRALALFIHKPFFLIAPDETPVPEWCVAPQALPRLIETLGPGLRLVASGHLHQGLSREVGGVRHVWAPSVGFPSRTPLNPQADPRVGLVVIDLHADGRCAVDIRQPDAFVQHDYQAVKQGAAFLNTAPEQPAPADWA